MSGDDEMDVYRERLGDALHRVAHPHHPWSGCAYPDLFYDKLTHFMGDLAASGLTVRPALLADTADVGPTHVSTPSVEPPTEWHPAIASDVANHYRAQSEFYVQQAEAMGVLLFKIIRALDLPPDASPTTDDDPLLFGQWRASRVLAALLPTQASDSPEKT